MIIFIPVVIFAVVQLTAGVHYDKVHNGQGSTQYFPDEKYPNRGGALK